MQIYDCDWYQFWGLSKLTGLVACELELLNDKSLATENTHYKYAWMNENTQ